MGSANSLIPSPSSVGRVRERGCDPAITNQKDTRGHETRHQRRRVQGQQSAHVSAYRCRRGQRRGARRAPRSQRRGGPQPRMEGAVDLGRRHHRLPAVRGMGQELSGKIGRRTGNAAVSGQGSGGRQQRPVRRRAHRRAAGHEPLHAVLVGQNSRLRVPVVISRRSRSGVAVGHHVSTASACWK